LELPKTTLILFILRGNDYIVPDGSTVIEKKDILSILSENEAALDSVFTCLKLNNI